MRGGRCTTIGPLPCLKELPKVYFERLLETSPDVVVAVDNQGVVIFYNAGAQDTLGYAGSEVLGTPVARLYPNEAEARRVMQAMRDGGGRVNTFETEFVAKDGRKVPVAISGSIIYDENACEQGSIGFAKDIARLREHDQLVTLGQLAVSLAHEVNNPLEVLVNQTELLERFLKQKASDEEYAREHERVESIKRELRRIQAHRDLGRALLQTGDTQGAITELKIVAQLTPDDSTSHYLLAQAYRKLGQSNEQNAELKLFGILRDAEQQLNRKPD